MNATPSPSIRIRPYTSPDLDQCRKLWFELTQHHRNIYNDSSIGGDDPGLHFDEHLGRVGPENLWVAECDGEVVGLVGLIVEDQEAEVEVDAALDIYSRDSARLWMWCRSLWSALKGVTASTTARVEKNLIRAIMR